MSVDKGIFRRHRENQPETFDFHAGEFSPDRWKTDVQIDRYVPTHCCYCGVQCGMYLKVADGKVVGVEPREDFPLNHGQILVTIEGIEELLKTLLVKSCICIYQNKVVSQSDLGAEIVPFGEPLVCAALSNPNSWVLGSNDFYRIIGRAVVNEQNLKTRASLFH